MTHLWWLLTPAQANAQPSSLVQLLTPMFLIIIVFYFVWYLPTRKRQTTHEEFLANLKKGDRVITTSGIYGKIIKAEGEIFVLEISDNIKVRVSKRAIGGLENDPAATQDGGQ